MLPAAPALATALAEVQARGRLIVLTSPGEFSALMRETSPGEFAGLDVELMRTFTRALAVDLEIRKVASFAELVPALVRGDGDAIASYFTMTEERSRLVARASSCSRWRDRLPHERPPSWILRPGENWTLWLPCCNRMMTLRNHGAARV
jgi:hypothetical protein